MKSSTRTVYQRSSSPTSVCHIIEWISAVAINTTAVELVWRPCLTVGTFAYTLHYALNRHLNDGTTIHIPSANGHYIISDLHPGTEYEFLLETKDTMDRVVGRSSLIKVQTEQGE